MNKDEFIRLHQHEIAGWIVDAATAGRSGGELASWLRFAMKKIDSRLAMIYDDLTAKNVNGVLKRDGQPAIH